MATALETLLARPTVVMYATELNNGEPVHQNYPHKSMMLPMVVMSKDRSWV